MNYIPGPPECENLEGYEEGGYHPVLIGDKFQERYSVVHKLGSGGYATVWLVRDDQQNRYAALKILTADSSSYSEELQIYQHLQKNGPEGYAKCRVVALLDYFWSESPNGRHMCLVFEVMGPSLASFQSGEMKKLRPDIVRTLALQTAQGLAELHQRGVAYGDLSAANLLFRLTNIDHWTTEELYHKLGRPEPIRVEDAVLNQPAEGEDFADTGFYEGKPSENPHAPESIYIPIDFSAIPIDLIEPEVRFIDLGEAYILESPRESPREGFGVNFSYADPETLWWSEKPEQAADVWALACIWYEMRAAEQLFTEGGFGGQDAIQNDVIDVLGSLPASWLEKLREDDDDQTAHAEDGFADLREDNNGLPPAASPLLVTLRSFIQWFRHQISKIRTATPDADRAPVSETDSGPQRDESSTAEEEDEESLSLSQKIKNIGQWRPWCYLSIPERIEKLKEFNKGTPRENDDVTAEADTGNPPPAPLSAEEATDFEAVLHSMLTYERTDRAALETVLEASWLHKDYAQSQSSLNLDLEPWLQQFHPGMGIEKWNADTGVRKRFI